MNKLRSIDKEGRISLPEEVRQSLGVFEGDEFEVIADGINIVLVRYTATCIACDDDTDVQLLNKGFFCGECRDAINKTLYNAVSH